MKQIAIALALSLTLGFAASAAQAADSAAPAAVAPYAANGLFDTNTHDAWADQAGLFQWNRTTAGGN